jgi:hypothetical protein
MPNSRGQLRPVTGRRYHNVLPRHRERVQSRICSMELHSKFELSIAMTSLLPSFFWVSWTSRRWRSLSE